MKSLIQELADQQEKKLAGLSNELAGMAIDQTAIMDAIADLYELITSVQDQLATIEAKTETSATRAEAAPGTGNSTEKADTTETEATTE